MAGENELLETVISTVTENSQGQSSEPNWLDLWSKQEIKIMQENSPAIGEILRLNLNQEEQPPKQDIIKLHPEAKIFWGLWEF